jgi:hypothetical protein
MPVVPIARCDVCAGIGGGCRVDRRLRSCARLLFSAATLLVALAASAETAPARSPRGPGDLPQRLDGRWRIGLCVDGGHCWLRFESLETREVHTLSRVRKGWGGVRDDETGDWSLPPADVSGVHWDRELHRDARCQGRHILLTIERRDPPIYHGSNASGYGAITNNCATFVRDGWEFYTGERFWLLWPHLPNELEHAVLVKHPEVRQSLMTKHR